MPSFQNGAGPGKSMKFVDALNPFAPFLAQPGDDEPVEEDLSPLTAQFDDRLRIGNQSGLSRGPTQQQQQQQQQQHQQSYDQQTTGSETVQNKNNFSLKKNNKKNNERDEEDKDDESAGDDDDDDSDFEFDDDDDAVLDAIRQKRLRQMQKAQIKEVEKKAKGHGEVRTITQDEFLTECTSSDYVAVHFFHKEFERCKIMDHHLKKIAYLHLSCKFVRIDAEKAPFFVIKLKVQQLPTLIVFKNGEMLHRLLGFEDLSDTSTTSRNPADIDDFPTSRLGYWLEQTGAIEYEGPDSDDEDDEEENNRRSRRSAASSSYDTNHHRSEKVYDEDV